MNLLKELGLEDFSDSSVVEKREAARAVLTDDQGLVPLLFVQKYEYHKLPGGGIETGEDIMTALERECMEEVGCKVDIKGEVGMVIEYRSEWKFHQTSYAYFGKILEKGEPDFTQEELDEEFTVVWVPFNQVVKKLTQDEPKNYEGGFIQQRDLAILIAAENLF